MEDDQLLSVIDHDDSYRLIRVLADKPSGKTELVMDSAGRLLVRKRVQEALVNQQAWKTLSELHSPLLPQVEDLYYLLGECVIVTTYVNGVTLSELVTSTGALDATEAVGYLRDLCAAASELHAHGIVHRDIAPGNVVVVDGRARLIDLGNVRAYAEGAQHDTTHLGTWGFAAPEQYGFAQTDARSDVYALGSVLGYMLTGVMPGDDAFEEALQSEFVPSDLRLVVQKARAFEPSARYQSAAALASAVMAVDSSHIEVAPMEIGDAPTVTQRAMSIEEQKSGARSSQSSGREASTEQPKAVDIEVSQARRPTPEPAPEPKAPASEEAPFLDRAWASFSSDWRAIGFIGKIRTIVRWTVAFFFMVIFLGVAFNVDHVPNREHDAAYVVIGLTWTACIVGLTAQVQKIFYDHELGRGGNSTLTRLLITVVKWLVIAAALAIAGAFVVTGFEFLFRNSAAS